MKNKKGFTLVEITIVVAIISLLSAIAMPSVVRARQLADEAKVLKELKSIGTAIIMYELEKSKSPTTWSDLVGYINVDKLQDNYELR